MLLNAYTVKAVLSGHSKRRPKLVFKTDYRLMQVKSIAECEHSAILSIFIELPIVIKIFVLSIFECPLETGFTVRLCRQDCTLKTFTMSFNGTS